MEENNRRNRLILFILGLISFLLVLGYLSGFFFFSNITPCLPPPGLMVDGAAFARVYTWLDENENGVVDANEEALPNVKLEYPPSYPDAYTDDEGRAETNDFKPGCVCDCWKNGYVEVYTPNGFRPATPLRQELIGDDLLYEFGFVKVSP